MRGRGSRGDIVRSSASAGWLVVMAGALAAVACATRRPDIASDRAVARAPWLWGRLQPGPHAVGLTVVTATDSTRPEPGAGAPGTRRPLELVIWYPARAERLTKRPVPFATYVDLSEGSMAEGIRGRAAEWRRRWLAEAVSREPASVPSRLVDSLLGTPMAARLDITPVPGRVPALLWSVRHATPAAQSVLSEYLASQGYVVAWMRYAGRDSLPPPFDDVTAERRAAMLEVHVADLQWALQHLRALPYVDSTRLGAMAWSYSGEPAAVLAQRTPGLRALVALSTNLFVWRYRAGDASASYDSLPIRASLAIVEETGEVRNRPREVPEVLDRFPGMVYRATIAGLDHGNFNVLEGMIPGLTGITTVQPWAVGGPVAQSGYETVARLVRASLDKMTRGAPGEIEALAVRDVRQPPTASVGVTIVRHGPGRAASPTAGTSFVNQPVTIENDGWRLRGDLVRPADPARVPAVLMLNKANGDRRVYADLARELARRNIASLRLDLRGHGESTNLATFVPGLQNAAAAGEERDVRAALAWLKGQPSVDPARVGVVGASYSGEAMMVAARGGALAQAYVGLSPGSLSEASIASIDARGVPWSIIVSRNERFLRSVVAAVRAHSRTAEVIEVEGTAHATDILVSHPELGARIADWLAVRLRR